MKKQLQFEIWEECNSKCKFCYLGKNNLLTPNHVKLKSLQLILDKISDLSIYDEYDVISYLGGEFFQGQLNTPEIKELFFKLMEKTAWKSVADFLEKGQCTVGTKLNLSHSASTPIGMKVICESELVAIEGRKLVFKISASDEIGIIGECEHERFIVEDEKFQNKTDSKMKK